MSRRGRKDTKSIRTYFGTRSSSSSEERRNISNENRETKLVRDKMADSQKKPDTEDIAELVTLIKGLDSKVTGLDSKVTEGFATLNENFDKLNTKVEALEFEVEAVKSTQKDEKKMRGGHFEKIAPLNADLC
jgi:hypothetical protein